MSFHITLFTLLFTLSGCSDLLDTKSDMVEFAEDNKLNSAQDTVYSMMGVIRGIQTIAERTMILGDVRSDQLTPTPYASTAIQQLASFQVGTDNPYNKVSDYYAIINNCNYFIENANLELVRLGTQVFEKEFAAVKAYRAWTYLQLVKNYGEVPLVLKPVLTEAAASNEMSKSYSNIEDICNYFIEDIKPYVDTQLPQFTGEQLHVPVRVLLGELCLWAGRYGEAAQYLHEYLTMKNKPVTTGKSGRGIEIQRMENGVPTTIRINGTAYQPLESSQILYYVPMEVSDYYGIKNNLPTVYESVIANNYFAEVVPSSALRKLSYNQDYVCLYEASQTEKDTVYLGKNWDTELLNGDLRLYSIYNYKKENVDENSPFSSDRSTVGKLSSSYITMYRTPQVYLMYAEALNRLGYPEAAFCVLKYGLRNQNIERYVSEKEREKAGELLNFDDEVFLNDNTQGIHARGCGDVDCDNYYCVPQPKEKLASYEDTVQYQIPLVEQMIIDEYALEFTYEGKRFYDLMRVALRRNDPAYLADAIARRNGKLDDGLRERLMDKRNWYLPLR